MKHLECTWKDKGYTKTLLRIASLAIDLEKGEIIARTDEGRDRFVFSKDVMKNISVEVEKD